MKQNGNTRAAAGSPSDIGEVAQALKACRGAFVGTGAFSCVINLLMLTGPLFMLQVYDRVLTSRSVPTLVALVVLVAGLFAILGFLEFIRSRVLVRVGTRLDADLSGRTYDAIVSQAVVSKSAVPKRDNTQFKVALRISSSALVRNSPKTVEILILYTAHRNKKLNFVILFQGKYLPIYQILSLSCNDRVSIRYLRVLIIFICEV